MTNYDKIRKRSRILLNLGERRDFDAGSMKLFLKKRSIDRLCEHFERKVSLKMREIPPFAYAVNRYQNSQYINEATPMTTKCLLFTLLLLNLLATPKAYAFNPYSTEELEQLEKQFVQLINQSDQIERSPLATQYINHIGKKLSQAAPMQSPTFFIVKSNEINAFAGPGGYIGINSALILATTNESELAAVMAHEMAHVRLHHLYRMIQHEKRMRAPMLASLLASAALGLINPTLASGAMAASLTGFAQDSINFTRSNDKEADRIGINMLMKAGFNPTCMASFFKKMQENTRYYYTANIPAILRSHPLDEDRIAEAENRSASMKKSFYPDTIDYHLFKEIIRNAVNNEARDKLTFYQTQCQRSQPAAACIYGEVLTLLSIDQFKKAALTLTPLINNTPNNLFYQFAMADAEIGNKEYTIAVKRLHDVQVDFPDNYAALMSYAQSLLDAEQNGAATSLLLKGFRQFKRDLPLCEMLAQSQAADHKAGYAYLTQSQCYLLQGRRLDALRQLKQAKLLAKNDHYLAARVDAMIDDIKLMNE